MNFGLTINNIRCLAYEYAKKCSIEYPVGWDKSGKATKDWYYGFMKRHGNLSLRRPELISANRRNGFRKETVAEFFTNLGAVLDGSSVRTTSHLEFRRNRLFNSSQRR
ncbi:hypothetical protein ABEB36_013809 [Hypothenemus hampei]